MLIDCGTCVVRGVACGDCVVHVLLEPVGGVVDWDDSEQRAMDALADGGLIPRSRFVPPVTSATPRKAGDVRNAENAAPAAPVPMAQVLPLPRPVNGPRERARRTG
ncbi:MULTISPECIES: hypothetical protein [Protofrankia]|nr:MULTISPECIES: hypothetical protein [Protofrankia]ONH37374.1 hypothetical protein BL254_03930 [Protofrankia sp. BMG5.30]